MQRPAGPGGLFNQIPVAQSEGIGVHHQAARRRPSAAGLRLPLQAAQIIGKTGSPVFHEDRPLAVPGDLREAQVPEDVRRGALCVEKQMVVSPFKLQLDKVPDQAAQQPLPLPVLRNGQAAEGIPGAGAGSDHLPIQENTDGLIQVPVSPEAACRTRRIS